MATVLYNCKHCKVGRRVEYPERQRGQFGYTPYRLEAGRRIFAVLDYDYSTRPAQVRGDARCPNCGRGMTWGFLQGFKVDTVLCDARCTSARGFRCDCSCGGENHGKDWSGLGAPLSEVLKVAA